MPEQNDIHLTANASPKAPDSMAENFKKYVPAAVFAVFVILASYVWTQNNGQSQLVFQVNQNQKVIEQLAANNKANADTMNQFLIMLTKQSEAQNRLAEDLKAVQQNQQRINDAMLDRKR